MAARDIATQWITAAQLQESLVAIHHYWWVPGAADTKHVWESEYRVCARGTLSTKPCNENTRNVTLKGSFPSHPEIPTDTYPYLKTPKNTYRMSTCFHSFHGFSHWRIPNLHLWVCGNCRDLWVMETASSKEPAFFGDGNCYIEFGGIPMNLITRLSPEDTSCWRIVFPVHGHLTRFT